MFFWNSLAFTMIQQMLAIWSLVPLPFSKSSLNIWKFMVHVLFVEAWLGEFWGGLLRVHLPFYWGILFSLGLTSNFLYHGVIEQVKTLSTMSVQQSWEDMSDKHTKRKLESHTNGKSAFPWVTTNGWTTEHRTLEEDSLASYWKTVYKQFI